MKRKDFLTEFVQDVFDVKINSYGRPGNEHATISVRTASANTDLGDIAVFCDKGQNTGLYYIKFKYNPAVYFREHSFKARTLEFKANMWLQSKGFDAVANIVRGQGKRYYLRIASMGTYPWKQRAVSYYDSNFCTRFKKVEHRHVQWSHIEEDINRF